MSLLFLELSNYCVNTVQLYVNAADVLVRRGIDGDGFIIPADLRGDGAQTSCGDVRA